MAPLHGSTVFAFRVAACNDAHIALVQNPDDILNNAIEIVLGGWSNAKSAIRSKPGGPNLVWVNTSYLLECKKMKSFWISWRDGLIQVGKGLPYEEVFMSWKDNSRRPVHSLALATGFGSEGDWQYFKERGTTIDFV